VSELIASSFNEGVLTVTLCRPEKRNALSRALIAAISAAFNTWSERTDVSIAVLTGSGDKAFASGGDLKELEVMRSQSDAVAFAAETRAAFDTIRRFPVPVVAVVNGDALGGGAELAMACDFRIAASHARIGFVQGRLNIATAWGGGTDLFQILGPRRALRLLCTSALLDAAAAHREGLVDDVAPAGPEAAGYINAYVANLATQKPQVMRAFKSLAVQHRFGASAADKAVSEGARFAEAWVHADHWAAVAAMNSRTMNSRTK
jgi:enoyl-CoA hydratase